MSKYIEEVDYIVDNCCDLDSEKFCDNCGKCLETDKEYNSIQITKIIIDEKDS